MRGNDVKYLEAEKFEKSVVDKYSSEDDSLATSNSMHNMIRKRFMEYILASDALLIDNYLADHPEIHEATELSEEAQAELFSKTKMFAFMHLLTSDDSDSFREWFHKLV